MISLDNSSVASAVQEVAIFACKLTNWMCQVIYPFPAAASGGEKLQIPIQHILNATTESGEK